MAKKKKGGGKGKMGEGKGKGKKDGAAGPLERLGASMVLAEAPASDPEWARSYPVAARFLETLKADLIKYSAWGPLADKPQFLSALGMELQAWDMCASSCAAAQEESEEARTTLQGAQLELDRLTDEIKRRDDADKRRNGQLDELGREVGEYKGLKAECEALHTQVSLPPPWTDATAVQQSVPGMTAWPRWLAGRA